MPTRTSPRAPFWAARAARRSSAVVIFRFRASPGTSRTEKPACSAAIASSVASTPASRAWASAASSTRRANACGVWASQSRSRGSVRATTGAPSASRRSAISFTVSLTGTAAVAAPVVLAACDRPLEERLGRKRPRRVVHHDHIGGRRDALEGRRHRILAAAPSRHHLQRLGAVPQVRRRIGGEIRRQRDDDLVDRGCVEERVDGALEDRHAADLEQLLGGLGTHARAASPGGNDGGHKHRSATGGRQSAGTPRRNVRAVKAL